MTLEQTYFPLGGGPNWNKIIFISIIIIAGGVIAYKIFVPKKIAKNPESLNETVAEEPSSINEKTDIPEKSKETSAS